MRIETKILVIGGGPAGATAASLLAAEGREVVLVERNLSSHKPCGGGVPSAAFEEFGIPTTVVRKEAGAIRLISPVGEAVEVSLSPHKIMIVDRGAFDTALRDAATRSGAKILVGSFVDAVKHGDRYWCTVESAEGPITVSAEYLIAADGVNSRVRLSQGYRPNSAFFTISETIPGMVAECCEFWFSSSHSPGFYGWRFPSRDGVSVGTGSVDAASLKALLAIFKRRVGLPEEVRGETKLFKIPVWHGNLYNRGKVLFVGDAAGQVMPLSYEGIYYAMKSGHAAAEAVLAGKPNLYKKLWENRLYKTFWFSKRLNEYFLRSDVHAERLVALHRREKIQAVAKDLWLCKNTEAVTIRDYLAVLRKLFV